MPSFQRAMASVRVRITAIGSLFVLLVTAVGSVVMVAVIGHTISNSLRDSALQDAAAIDAQLARGVSPAAAATTGRNDVIVQLIAADGTVKASDHPAHLSIPLRTTPGVTSSQIVPDTHDTFIVVGRRASAAARSIGIALIVVGRTTEQRDETKAETAGVLAISVPLTVAVLALILWISIGRALRPVEVMRKGASRITSAHRRARLAVPPGNDEIPRLARTLNQMLDGIEEGQRLQRQFVSDASHELRSPLTVIRQAAEVAKAYPSRVKTESLADDVLQESARLEGLVTALLLLARLDYSGDVGQEDVDLDDVVLAEVARVRAAGPAVAIDLADLCAGRVLGNPVLLGQLVRNLLDNGIRHAKSRVVIALTTRGDHVRLTVEDDGSGIPDDQREVVFERFTRLDEARASDSGGSGLGLAIARKIAEATGGTIMVDGSALGGARFTVLFPAAAE